MDATTALRLSVSDVIALTNQTLEYAYPSLEVEGEVASFKVNQGKYVFFDLKDEGGTLGCFMTVWQLRLPIEDGMKVVVTATPKLTQWGKFSLTVRAVRPSGEGSLKKSFDLLKAKLTQEGLFGVERKRQLPAMPHHVGVISSLQAAGYADFMRIIDDRWAGLRLEVAHVQVQGSDAPDQMIRALRHFNEQAEPPQAIVLIRGGGSADDLSAFNDELLVREIAGSRVPTLVGVGHEIDETLADLAADVRAATPSNAAQLLVPDKQAMIQASGRQVKALLPQLQRSINDRQQEVGLLMQRALQQLHTGYDRQATQLLQLRRLLAQLDPRTILARGYAIARGDMRPDGVIEIETQSAIITAEVRHVTEK